MNRNLNKLFCMWLAYVKIAEKIEWRSSSDRRINRTVFQVCFLTTPESIERFIEDQPLSLSYDLAPPHPLSPLSRQQVLSLCQSSCVSPVELTNRRVGGGGVCKIIRVRESLVLYKSFNTLCFLDRKCKHSIWWHNKSPRFAFILFLRTIGSLSAQV